MKRDSIKEKYDISLYEIYETLAEIEIESKCFSSAFSYLEKASEILDSINIHDSIDKKTIESKSEIEKYHSIKKKISILSEFRISLFHIMTHFSNGEKHHTVKMTITITLISQSDR